MGARDLDATSASIRPMVTSNCRVLETCALLQRRLGMGGVKTFRDDIVPAVEVDWFTPR
jgi:hypothetical protein